MKLPIFDLSMQFQSRQEWSDTVERAATWEDLIAAAQKSKLASYLNVDGYFG